MYADSSNTGTLPVTVPSCTWTLLHDPGGGAAAAGRAPPPGRLFIGSGIPRGLWRRVERRFAPARVLESYACTETGAIMVNLRDVKAGAIGRPLRGSPEVRIAAMTRGPVSSPRARRVRARVLGG